MGDIFDVLSVVVGRFGCLWVGLCGSFWVVVDCCLWAAVDRWEFRLIVTTGSGAFSCKARS